MRTLVAIPVYNEEKYIRSVVSRVVQHAPNEVLVIDDGSTDHTPCLLAEQHVEVIRHATNRGYGRSMQDAFRWAAVDGYDWLITMDCDEQHEPEAIGAFLDAAATDQWDVISGSRYLSLVDGNGCPPAARRAINQTIAADLNERLGLAVTDAFCGFKAYRVAALRGMSFTESGYAFPLQFWVQAVAKQLRITEIPVKLIYNDPTRTFGGPLNDDCVRLAHYREVLDAELTRCADRLPAVQVRTGHGSPRSLCGECAE
ncbi:MAG: glycosyltransferase family 2 protein [Phycisphaerales bacterium]|nr:glycosyltransferase family 2 protein [Phycisphaerales bacterium]